MKELTQEQLDSIEKSNQEQIIMFEKLDKDVADMIVYEEISYQK